MVPGRYDRPDSMSVMSTLPDLIGVCGYARSGKTTLADWLKSERGFTVLAPSLTIRASLHALNPIVGSSTSGGCEYPIRVADLIADPLDEAEWDTAKAGPFGRELRVLLQRLGGEASRQIVGDDVWIASVVADAEQIVAAGGKVVVPSIRYGNEADAVLNAGVIVRVLRDGTGPVNDHPSETAMDDYPVHAAILNDGTADQLGRCVEAVLSQMSEPVVTVAEAIERALAVETFTTRLVA